MTNDATDICDPLRPELTARPAGEPRAETSRQGPVAASSQPQARNSAKLLAASGLLVLAVGLVFGQTLGHEFINFDDNFYVYENPQVSRGLTVDGLVWAFSGSHVNNWHPLSWLSHMLDCQIFGLKAGGHHLTNVLLHAAAAIALLLVLLRMTGDLWPSTLVAVLFAIHPLHVESVAWVSERKDVLSGLLFVLTLGAYVGYARRPFSLFRYLAVLLLFALGLMAKPMLVTLPFVLLLVDYWPLARLEARGLRLEVKPGESSGLGPAASSLKSQASRLFVEKIPLLAMSGGACIVTLLSQTESIQSTERFLLPARVANALVSYVAYLGQFFYPTRLAVFYPFPDSSLPLWQVAGSAMLLAGISIGAVLSRRKCPYLLVGWFWYLGMLLPVIGLVQAGSQARADRYTYLPLIGLTIAIVWGAARFCAIWPQHRLVQAMAALLLIAGLMGCAWRQTTYWRDSVSVWTHTLAVTSRNALAHNDLAIALAGKGETDAAIANLREALEIEPNYAEAHCNLAAPLTGQGKLDEAIDHCQKALALWPGYAQSHYDLANALARQGNTGEAIAEFRKALEINPLLALAHNNLAAALAGQGKIDEAMAHYAHALEIQPDFSVAHYNLGSLLDGQGKTDEAVEHYRKALEFQPSHAQAHNNLANILTARDQSDEAASHYRQALEIDPKFAGAHFNLAKLLASQGKADEAIAHYEQGLKLQPNYADAHFNLGTIFYGQGNARKAVSHWREAARLQPNHVVVLQRLAWALATSPDASLRNGPKAVELADRAMQLSGGQDPALFDTLAAAYAETGQFPQAIKIATQGLRLANSQQNSALAAALRARLSLYRAGVPYRVAAP